MEATRIRGYAAIEPQIYAYQTPDVASHVGWTKIGEARRQTVAERIAQQTKTVGVRAELCWAHPARTANGAIFRDRALHRYLEAQGVERGRDAQTQRPLEWFRITPEAAEAHYYDFRGGAAEAVGQEEYFLRHEQAEAVDRTAAYFAGGGKAFLWNAKPRFGKTLAAYHLARRMGCTKVLVLTNRPAVSAGWVEDFRRFIAWQTGWKFVSDNEQAWKVWPAGVLARDSFVGLEGATGFVAFESLQGLKGATAFGGKFAKLDWMAALPFDLLILDEAHEGTETEKAAFAIERIHHRHRLHLSGTPFKQLSGGDFRPEQIFTWSYVDEQAAKAEWAGEENNPYEALPTLKMFTYQLSPMVEAEVRCGFDEEHQYAFDLAEFFKTKADGTFAYEDKVRAFLRTLTISEKYPFSTPERRAALRHTLWMLNRVKSAKALERLLKEEGSPFRDYEVVLAAGDGKGADEENAVIADSALERVRKAIHHSGKPTITLTVGQLTVGVTVPEWTGILMLNTLKSPAAYFQATFRVQNPHVCTAADGQVLMKEEAYVFDFDPTRTLELFATLANETVEVAAEAGEGESARRERRIRTLLNFYPVIGEDEAGTMVALDVAQVLAIPARIKCQEVVKQGFISNFLFRNLTGIFRNRAAYAAILDKMPVAKPGETKVRLEPSKLEQAPEVDATGEVVVPQETVVGKAAELFGDKVYGTEIETPSLAVAEGTPMDYGKTLAEEVMAQVREPIVNVATQNLQPKAKKKVAAAVEEGLRKAIRTAELAHAAEPESVRAEAMATAAQDYARDLPLAVTAITLRAQAEERKQSAEDKVRDHLRGFTRTIPCFLMAYGDDALTLANFDGYVELEVFEELTGITLDDFRLLRDGGTLEGEPVEGHVFDEQVFNDAVREFMAKKRALANYFDAAHTEDIFDYIPPQKTNQIFTPRDVVVRMVDSLEREDPGCFDDPTRTFADLYVKSGLFLAEIAKRLYRSPALARAFPESRARIAHIFRHQLYGLAPSRIIYLIVVAYLLGFDGAPAPETCHIVLVKGLLQATKEGRLQAVVDAAFAE